MNRKGILTSTASILAIIIMALNMMTPSFSETQLTDTLADDWSPAVIQTSDSKIWVVWHSYRTGNAEIFYKIYDGTEWSVDKNLTDHAYVDGLPSIMQANDGTIWVVWTSNRNGGYYDILCKNSSDGGASWSGATFLTSDAIDDRHPSIMQTNDGKIWVVWQSRETADFDLVCKTSSDGGASWSDKISLTTDTNDDEQPSIMQASDGTIWIVWVSNRTQNDDLFCMTSSNNGVSWSETQLTTNNLTDFFPSIMQASDGTIWVVWESDRNGQPDIFYKLYRDSSWSSENFFTWFMDEDIMPSIFQSANGTTWLMWATDKPSNFDIYYKFVEPDMALLDVTTSSTILNPGDNATIYAVVRNEGNIGLTFNVTCFYNGIPIGTQTKTLVPSNFGFQLSFPWNLTGINYGYYVVSATLNSILSEDDYTNNSFNDGTITVTIPGDVNGDRKVNIYDAGALSAHWYPGPPVGPLGYDPNADVNNDGKIDMEDVGPLNANWQSSW